MPSLLALPACGTLLAIAWESSPDRWINHATNPTRCARKSAAQLKNSIITPMGRTLEVARASGEILHYAMQFFPPALYRATGMPAERIWIKKLSILLWHFFREVSFFMCFIISTCFVGNHLTWVVFIFFVSRDILFGAENGACMHCGDIKIKKNWKNWVS